ncbi:MAG: hypothetical protein IPK55_13060 [Streptococcus sp.]|nr:hypothetical protein [Streptococcus sp.]
MYRLITIDTIEEKIMSLQNFKKKLHKLLIAEKQATGASGEDKGSEIKITELMKTF